MFQQVSQIYLFALAFCTTYSLQRKRKVTRIAILYILKLANKIVPTLQVVCAATKLKKSERLAKVMIVLMEKKVKQKLDYWKYCLTSYSNC